MKTTYLRLSVLTLSLYLCNLEIFAQEAEFNNSFLYGENSKQLDLDKLLSSDRVLPGDYLLDVYLNGKYITRSNVKITDDINPDKYQRYCIPQKTVKQLDFNPKLIDLDKNKSECIDTRLMNHVVFWTLDIQNQRLDVASPQAMINERPHGYISPELWDSGHSSAFLKYYVNYYDTNSKNSTNENSGFINLNSGINFYNWQFRHSGSTTLNDIKNTYNSYETKILRVFPAIKSQFTLGDFYTDTTSFNTNPSISIRGVQLANDSRMLPSSLQNYAPVISGYARSNALVRVWQNQQIIMERSVPAGEFHIQDLQTSSRSGLLTVDIIEANGEIRTFEIPHNTAVNALRPNQYQYQVATGLYRKDTQSFNEKIFSASFNYGLNNFVTLNSALIFSDHYQSYTLGNSFNTRLGAIAIEGNYIQAKPYLNDETRKSHQFSLRYNLAFNDSKSYLTLNNTLYGNKHYFNFNDVMQNRYSQNDLSTSNDGEQPKSLNYVQYTQTISPQLGSFSAMYSQYNYWNNNKRTSYQASYSNRFKNISFNLGVQQTQNEKNIQEEDRLYYLNIDIPLDIKKKRAYVRMNADQYKENTERNANQIGLFGNAGKNDQFSYSVNYANTKRNDQFSSALGYQTTPISLSTTYATDFKDQHQYSIQAQGAIVAHRYGLTLSNNLNDTFAIVHADGLEGTELTNGTRIDMFGNAIIPYLSPYQYNTLSLNPNTIPLKTNVNATQIQIIPKSYSSVLVEFNASQTANALIKLSNSNAEGQIPMGSSVSDDIGQTVALVAQGQQIYLQNIKTATYTVQLSQHSSCKFNITDDLLKSAQSAPLFATFSLKCS